MEGLESNPGKSWKQEDVIVDFPEDRSNNEPPKLTLEDAIRESGAVVLDAGIKDLDTRVDRERFESLGESAVDMLQDLADRAGRYLSRPLIADTFEDQDRRRDWRTSLAENYSPEVVEFFEDNRLRLNNIHMPLYMISRVDSSVLKKVPVTNVTGHLRNLFDDTYQLTGVPASFEQRYRPMSLAEKIAFTSSYGKLLREYLTFVGVEQERVKAA